MGRSEFVPVCLLGGFCFFGFRRAWGLRGGGRVDGGVGKRGAWTPMGGRTTNEPTRAYIQHITRPQLETAGGDGGAAIRLHQVRCVRRDMRAGRLWILSAHPVTHDRPTHIHHRQVHPEQAAGVQRPLLAQRRQQGKNLNVYVKANQARPLKGRFGRLLAACAMPRVARRVEPPMPLPLPTPNTRFYLHTYIHNLTHTGTPPLFPLAKHTQKVDGGFGGHLEHHEEEHPGGAQPRGEARQCVFSVGGVFGFVQAIYIDSTYLALGLCPCYIDSA